jgi:MOSC domain-containing protein YiiM
MSPIVVAVARSPVHAFSKPEAEFIELVAGLGVDGDAHEGVTVKHRSRVAQDPTQPNLRQVHLIHAELHDELQEKGFDVFPGAMGENITTRHLDLLSMPRGARLAIGETALVEITGLRNPCAQLDNYQPGLMKAVLDTAPDGSLIRKAGIMGIVISGGLVRAGDDIVVSVPAPPHIRLERV